MLPGDYIEFDRELRVLCFLLTGEWPIQANARAALESSEVYTRLAAEVKRRCQELDGSVAAVRDALPGSAGQEYARSVDVLTGGAGGRGLVRRVGDFADDMGRGQLAHAQSVLKAKVSMEWELASVMLELASIAALSYFTGGLSWLQAARVKARARLRLLTIMHYLARRSRLVPGLGEAVEEGLQEFLSQLTMMTVVRGELRQRNLNWRDLAQSSTMGLFAEVFSGLTRKLLDPLRHLLKDAADKKFSREAVESLRDAVSEALGEAAGEFLNTGLWDKRWQFRTDSMLGAGVSSIVTRTLFTTAGDLGIRLGGWKDRGPGLPHNPATWPRTSTDTPTGGHPTAHTRSTDTAIGAALITPPALPVTMPPRTTTPTHIPATTAHDPAATTGQGLPLPQASPVPPARGRQPVTGSPEQPTTTAGDDVPVFLPDPPAPTGLHRPTDVPDEDIHAGTENPVLREADAYPPLPAPGRTAPVRTAPPGERNTTPAAPIPGPQLTLRPPGTDSLSHVGRNGLPHPSKDTEDTTPFDTPAQAETSRPPNPDDTPAPQQPTTPGTGHEPATPTTPRASATAGHPTTATNGLPRTTSPARPDAGATPETDRSALLTTPDPETSANPSTFGTLRTGTGTGTDGGTTWMGDPLKQRHHGEGPSSPYRETGTGHLVGDTGGKPVSDDARPLVTATAVDLPEEATATPADLGQTTPIDAWSLAHEAEHSAQTAPTPAQGGPEREPDALAFPGSQAPVGADGARPYTNAAELLRDLRASVVEADGTRAEPEFSTELLGPDLFGLRRPAPPPLFLAGHDYSSLSGERVVSFFRRLDMAGPAPAPAEMAPASLPPTEGTLVVERSGDELTDWAPGASVNLPPLPEVAEMPNVISSIWLGSPLRNTGNNAEFRENVQWMAQEYAGAAVVVLWTDVPRSLFDRAKEPSTPMEDAELTEVRDMLAWARASGVILLNVDEVFNAESPMVLHDFYRSETAKHVGAGYAAASDILRLEILYRFGGIYIDGDNRLHDPAGAFVAVSSPEGYGIDNTGYTLGNSAMAIPRKHPFAELYLTQIGRQYALSQYELMYDLADVAPEEFATSQGRIRRNSVMQRTGPDVINTLARELGVGLPPLEGVHTASALSWLEPPEQPTAGRLAAGRRETLRLAQAVVQTLVRGLHNRIGDLHLTQVDPVISRHPQPEVIWEAVLRFLAQAAHIVPPVQTVTYARIEPDGGTAVGLPPAAEELLDVKDDVEPQSWLGEWRLPAALRPPVSAPATPASPASPATTASPGLPDTAEPSPNPVPPHAWTHRRGNAPVAVLHTEIFDPRTSPAGSLTGNATYVRVHIRRIQATDGRWVLELTVILPVKLGTGTDARTHTALQDRLTRLMDQHINRGYLLPGSRDQFHAAVELVVDPGHPEAVEITRTQHPQRWDQHHFHLHAAQDSPESRHDDGRLIHEILHYLGVGDHYHDPESLFRRHTRHSEQSGVMTDPADLFAARADSARIPAAYLAQIEKTLTSGPVIRDHPLDTNPPGPSQSPRPPAPETPPFPSSRAPDHSTQAAPATAPNTHPDTDAAYHTLTAHILGPGIPPDTPDFQQTREALRVLDAMREHIPELAQAQTGPLTTDILDALGRHALPQRAAAALKTQFPADGPQLHRTLIDTVIRARKEQQTQQKEEISQWLPPNYLWLYTTDGTAHRANLNITVTKTAIIRNFGKGQIRALQPSLHALTKVKSGHWAPHGAHAVTDWMGRNSDFLPYLVTGSEKADIRDELLHDPVLAALDPNAPVILAVPHTEASGPGVLAYQIAADHNRTVHASHARAHLASYGHTFRLGVEAPAGEEWDAQQILDQWTTITLQGLRVAVPMAQEPVRTPRAQNPPARPRGPRRSVRAGQATTAADVEAVLNPDPNRSRGNAYEALIPHLLGPQAAQDPEIRAMTHNALRVLDALREHVPELTQAQTGPLTTDVLDALAQHLPGKNGSVPSTRQLMELAAAAQKQGLAGSLHQLAAFALRDTVLTTRSALAPRTEADGQ
ncbi:glycosyltransferase [Streptomyces sp. NPDC006654]|uniref:glycosyltransferase n=1 Tax=Streptomyces sp. NPDC006654 TaxID=3156897 RepID=UPI0033C57097